MQHPMAFYEEVIRRSGETFVCARFCLSYAPSILIDPRVKDWLWMQSPIPTVLLCALYLLCVAVGPRVMKNREPFDLRRVLILYNFGLVALSGYIVYQVRVIVCLCVCGSVCVRQYRPAIKRLQVQFPVKKLGCCCFLEQETLVLSKKFYLHCSNLPRHPRISVTVLMAVIDLLYFCMCAACIQLLTDKKMCGHDMHPQHCC